VKSSKGLEKANQWLLETEALIAPAEKGGGGRLFEDKNLDRLEKEKTACKGKRRLAFSKEETGFEAEGGGNTAKRFPTLEKKKKLPRRSSDPSTEEPAVLYSGRWSRRRRIKEASRGVGPYKLEQHLLSLKLEVKLKGKRGSHTRKENNNHLGQRIWERFCIFRGGFLPSSRKRERALGEGVSLIAALKKTARIREKGRTAGIFRKGR